MSISNLVEVLSDDAAGASSSDLNISPFEGPEKLLEIWFAPSPADVRREDDQVDGNGVTRSGLRKVKREEWEEMLAIVKCQVLSVVHGQEMDAYLLSESSLFVSPHRLILKTCGTTLNLLGLPKILSIASSAPCHLDSVYRLFYSRKSFMFPERQQGPHREWKEEVAFLDRMFGVGHQKEGWRGPGSAYTVGSVNRDHWLLYMTAPGVEDPADMDPLEDEEPLGAIPTTPITPPLPDFTIEILMSKLSASARRPFIFGDVKAGEDTVEGSTDEFCAATTPHHARGLALSHELGIHDLFPSSQTTLDAFAFEPCGYSANALIRHDDPTSEEGEGEGYYTIHVTPEEGWSYASFECNVPLPPSPLHHRHHSDDSASDDTRHDEDAGGAEQPPPRIPDLQTLIQRVVKIFQPGHLSLTLFVSTTPTSSTASEDTFALTAIETAQATFHRALTAKDLGFNYRRTDKINYEFGGYDLAFASFERKGGACHAWERERVAPEWDVVVA